MEVKEKTRKKVKPKKTEKQVLEQMYMTSDDLKVICPTMGINARGKFISEIREEMKKQNYYLPTGWEKLALTKLVKEKLGI